LRSVVEVATGGSTVRYGGYEIDFGQPFRRITMREAIAHYFPDVGYDVFGLDKQTVVQLLNTPRGVWALHTFVTKLDSYAEHVETQGQDLDHIDIARQVWDVINLE